MFLMHNRAWTTSFFSAVREELGQRTLVEIVVTPPRGYHENSDRALPRGSTRTGALISSMCGLNAQTCRAKTKTTYLNAWRAERERQAKEYRAEGEEEALKIRAEADLEVARLKSEALQKSQLIRGEGDAEALRIYADAFEQDPRFFPILAHPRSL